MHVTRKAQVGWLLSVKQHVTEINRYCIVCPWWSMGELIMDSRQTVLGYPLL